MGYEPTEWKAGDVVTSAKLNKLEQGVANNGILKVTLTGDSETHEIYTDVTYNEVFEAVSNGTYVYGLFHDIATMASDAWVVCPARGLYYYETLDEFPKHYIVAFGDFFAMADTPTELLVVPAN